MSLVSRRDVVRACKHRGWTIQPAALAGLLEYVSSEQDVLDILDLVSNSQHMKNKNGKTVTAAIWQELVEEQQQQEEEEMLAASRNSRGGRTATTLRSKKNSNQTRTARASRSDVEVVSAFDTPKLVFESMRKQFRVEENTRSLFGTAEDQVNMLSQRYALIHQRLLRHSVFRPSNLGHGATTSTQLQQQPQQQQHKLTPIESLLGKSTRGSSGRTILLLAVLIQIEEGQYYLEDPTGQLPVSFQSAMAVDGFFVTEKCILLVEGTFQDGIFFVQRLGHPLLESRHDSLAAIQQQVLHPAFSSPKPITDNEEVSFVLVSDLHLDQPRVLQQLEGLLAMYENYSPNRLPVFVLMGNFVSKATLFGSNTNSNNHSTLEELGSLLASFSNLAMHAHFVLVPGPHDCAASVGNVLPSANLLSRNGFGRVEHVHWASNPCRIRWHGREMVVFRYDLLHLMQRQQVLLQEKTNDNNTTDDDSSMDDKQYLRLPHCRLVKTILDQGHLVPVAGVPMYWNYSHALSLYPLPDVLVLGGDNCSEGFHEIYEGVHVVHPGSVAAPCASYATFTWNNNNEDDDMDDDDEEGGVSGSGGATVEFAKLGNQEI